MTLPFHRQFRTYRLAMKWEQAQQAQQARNCGLVRPLDPTQPLFRNSGSQTGHRWARHKFLPQAPPCVTSH
jgi:hypothetical protein